MWRSQRIQVIEPPCTEPYARWSERSSSQLMARVLLDYTQKASDFRYDVSTTKHIRKEINMANLHSTALLLGIKDPHIKLSQGLQEESYG